MLSPNTSPFWVFCLDKFRQILPDQQFSTWIKPLVVSGDVDQGFNIYASNSFIQNWVRDKYLSKIIEFSIEFHQRDVPIQLLIGKIKSRKEPEIHDKEISVGNIKPSIKKPSEKHDAKYKITKLQPEFTFDNLVVGKANDLARAAAVQVSENPGGAYNPLFIYGGTGLGKTHLMLAIGNKLFGSKPDLVIRYAHAEDYYTDVVKAYQQKTFDKFKQYYKSLDVLLLDDVQFFINKQRSQEELFFAFNALIESKKQIVITCDTYPKDISGLDDRLITRFDWGLTVQLEPPETEMRVAILKKKALFEGIDLNNEVSFFIAKNLRSNVRELEGALKKVLAYSSFHKKQITLDVAKEALKDMIGATRNITIEGIQKTVADFYKIKVSDFFSKNRSRQFSRPRQIAMWLSKELTQKSYPMIGESFGGRDHSTVIHAINKINDIRKKEDDLNHDIHFLMQVLRG